MGQLWHAGLGLDTLVVGINILEYSFAEAIYTNSAHQRVIGLVNTTKDGCQKTPVA